MSELGLFAKNMITNMSTKFITSNQHDNNKERSLDNILYTLVENRQFSQNIQNKHVLEMIHTFSGVVKT